MWQVGFFFFMPQLATGDSQGDLGQLPLLGIYFVKYLLIVTVSSDCTQLG